MNFQSIKAAREYLLANGYIYNGLGAMTGAECWKRNGDVVFIRRSRYARGVVVA